MAKISPPLRAIEGPIQERERKVSDEERESIERRKHEERQKNKALLDVAMENGNTLSTQTDLSVNLGALWP